MNAQSNQDTPARDSLLDGIEQAVQEKAQTGHADEAHHGFVAQLVNATPPVNDAFQRKLRARILAEETGDGKRTVRGQDHAQPVNLWRFAVVTLAAILTVTLVFTRARTQVFERNGVRVGHLSSGARLTAEDFDALAEALNAAPANRTVVVYPDCASPIAERTRHKTVPLVLSEDTTPAAIRGALGMILPPSGFVDLVVAGAQENDTTRQVRAAVEQTLYRLYQPSGQADTQTYGALERSAFVVGPMDVTLEPIGALFEGGVELASGDVLDDPQPGIPLRMAFDWRIQEPLDDSLVMFVHLFRDDVELVAQRDAVPGNGLFPVEDWRPGETVRDQFALLLPSALPPGEYEIRLGVYASTTQMRYSLIEPEGGTYVVVRHWDVR